LRTAYSWWQSD